MLTLSTFTISDMLKLFLLIENRVCHILWSPTSFVLNPSAQLRLGAEHAKHCSLVLAGSIAIGDSQSGTRGQVRQLHACIACGALGS